LGLRHLQDIGTTHRVLMGEDSELRRCVDAFGAGSPHYSPAARQKYTRGRFLCRFDAVHLGFPCGTRSAILPRVEISASFLSTLISANQREEMPKNDANRSVMTMSGQEGQAGPVCKKFKSLPILTKIRQGGLRHGRSP
jgi:hypothetical protein